MSLAFDKYEGLGNDFVLVQAKREDEVSPELARALCDRRLGVGADGVLLVLPPASPEARARMRVINADGSVPEMCGNGLRCVALAVARTQTETRSEVSIETDAGLKRCLIDDDARRGLVTVDMGRVTVLEDVRLDVDGAVWVLSIAEAGNPHAIVDREVTRAQIDAVGPKIATHPRFPGGTNVEFARFRMPDVDLVVWERGVGVTQACGTGACATAAVAVAKGHAAPGAEQLVHLPGGTLSITIREDGRAIMRGPARHVFSGTYEGGA